MMATFYQVGGSVRDELLGQRSKDVDFAVEAESYEAMREAILARGDKIYVEHPEFLTIRAKALGYDADFVLCRKDGTYKDGRRPESVEPGTIYDDLARRDFTVNAIAKDEDGIYIDPFGGREDAQDRILRAVGDPMERFHEDGLRPLRAIRFMVTKGLRPDLYLEADLKSDLAGFLVSRVAIERIREELLKAFRYDTWATLEALDRYPAIKGTILQESPIWLEPTLKG